MLKISISALIVTVVSSNLFTVNPSVAGTDGSGLDSSASKTYIVNRAITESEVLAAQRAWGEALVDISIIYETKGIQAAKTLAEKVIDEVYAYQLGAVLFNPTLAKAPQAFRTSRAGAIAYFVGNDPNFPMDTGFALEGWRKVEIKNVAMFFYGTTATTMGNVILTDKDGMATTVDKTWQFIKDDNGRVRIVLHHSSLPYGAKIS
ncbi:hypothetical protein GlitD10_1648 [Gloeomargarita lithophora Alchichica-D10]|uniref:Phosphoribosyl-AMP cyclohydrolase n=1 Tax=Gloeomargarita lithophora Alchichica-D10 TaxID=1188229 RepID=A0A1J0ADF7_9CYAN|nr:hypothetical protein [Gloeomargarita lithophora]APB33972.1 hypothetical protein GlitD10_1648 [Gloeomargarita lithophora Alchichica-D10]